MSLGLNFGIYCDVGFLLLKLDIDGICDYNFIGVKILVFSAFETKNLCSSPFAFRYQNINHLYLNNDAQTHIHELLHCPVTKDLIIDIRNTEDSSTIISNIISLEWILLFIVI
jgi:hypothetical protein